MAYSKQIEYKIHCLVCRCVHETEVRYGLVVGRGDGGGGGGHVLGQTILSLTGWGEHSALPDS